MVMPLLLAALVAHIFILVSSTETASSSSSVLSTAQAPPCKPSANGTCETLPVCRLNEVWAKCSTTVCRPKTCNDLGFPVACPDLSPDGKCPDKPGCICQEGYVKNNVNICIPMKHCPTCGGDSNAVSSGTGCGTNNCNRLCSNYNKKPGPCTLACPYNSCDCRPGFVFDEVKRKCVFPSQCTSCKGVNEIFDQCPAPCPPQNCNVNPALILCAVPPKLGDPECKPGCRCIDNYVRNSTNVCIPRDQCPKCPKPNQVYDPCIAPCLRRRCDVDERLIKCAAPPKIGDPLCVAGCRCADGYYLNKSGVCVTKAECPPICIGNEEYNDCVQGYCLPKNCSQLGFSIACPRIDPKYCKKGCLCKDGYLRSDEGVCIPVNECPSCGGDPNAVSGCGNKCGNLCTDYFKNVACTLECQNINGCDCREGYVYDNITMQCVLPQDCTSTCGANEVLNDCVQGYCLPKNCSQLGFSIACPRIDPKYCKKGCLCKDGYVRRDDGVCIPVNECPSCGGDPNAVSGCGNKCGNLCTDYFKNVACTLECQNINGCNCRKGYVYDNSTMQCVLPKDCTQVCKKNEVYSECINGGCTAKNCSQFGTDIPCVKLNPNACIKGCLCKTGYLREKNGECVLEKDCTNICKKPNEQYTCDYNCPPNTCESLKNVYICPIREGETCKGRCKCKQGYLRNILGDCITEAQCRKCMGPNEFFSCGGACDNVCKTLTLQNQTNCLIRNIKCNEMCYCKKGFARAENKTCIPIKDCIRQCGINEVYSECINGGCTAKNCSQIGRDIPCVKLNPDSCIKGCLCKEGFLREENGECVPEKECKSQCKKPNEYYETCDYNCPPNTCASLNMAYACPIREGDTCKGRCKCTTGHFRNILEECITEAQCRKCMGPHEYFSCKGACDNVCKSLATRNQTNCPIKNKKCTEKCYCEKGYARALNETCIPIKDCKKPQCKKNEIYDKCPASLCGPKKCSELGYPILCPFIPFGSKCPGKPGCKCVDGYVKSPRGICIPKEDCPSCGGDPNAQSGAGTNCGKKCEDLGKEPGPCEDIFGFNACDCKPGYYFDKKKKKCVLPSQCTNICSGKNEVFENCTNPTCDPRKCSEVGFSLNCTNPPACNKGCVCKSGYVRNCEDICIPIKQCPSCKGDENAISGCGVHCSQKCSDLQNPDKPKICPKYCKVNSCDCKKNYYYDENTETCVLAKECTQTCNNDEVFDPCINGGCSIRNCSQISSPTLCIDPIKCKPGCTCKKGYLRSEKGICIQVEKCPEAICCKHEEFAICPDALCKPLYCNQLGRSIRCPKNGDNCFGYPSCVCKDDYVRNAEGECIPKNECPPLDLGCLSNLDSIVRGYACGENEVYENCVNGGCKYRNCSELDGPILCIDPIKCEGGCTCKKDYVRLDATGVCVPKEQCPKTCKKPNEVFIKCPPICPPQTCASLNKTYPCPLIKVKINESDCVGECRCIEGFYRNTNGDCISKKDCNTCKKPNEEYVKSPPTCPPQTCESLNKTYFCPLMKVVTNESDCVGECRCMKGFYRNINGECVSKEYCLKCTGDNEYYACGPECDNVCRDLNKQTKDNCPIKNVMCVSKCYCRDGYARDSNGSCVCISDCPVIPVNSTEALTNFKRGNTLLVFKFLNEMLNQTRANFMASTLSLLIVLAQLTIYAFGTSLVQLLGLFNVRSKDELRAALPILIKSFKGQTDVVFKLENKCYANVDYPLTESFINDGEDLFDAAAENVNFNNPINASKQINDWVANSTNNLIKDIVSPDMFDSQTRLVLINCLYFLGNWLYQFDKKNTMPADFYLNENDVVSLPTMNLRKRLQYWESDELDAQFVRLPYKGNKFSLLICLPKTKTGLTSLVGKLDPDIFDKIFKSLKVVDVQLSVPVMDYATSIPNLIDFLKKFGVTAPFVASNDFRGIFKNNESLYISDAIQKTVMKVDETGTEAAAVTAIVVGTTAVLEDIIYTVQWNRPGAFFITFDDIIVFFGVFAGTQ